MRNFGSCIFSSKQTLPWVTLAPLQLLNPDLRLELQPSRLGTHLSCGCPHQTSHEHYQPTVPGTFPSTSASSQYCLGTTFPTCLILNCPSLMPHVRVLTSSPSLPSIPSPPSPGHCQATSTPDHPPWATGHGGLIRCGMAYYLGWDGPQTMVLTVLRAPSERLQVGKKLSFEPALSSNNSCNLLSTDCQHQAKSPLTVESSCQF